MAWKRSGVQFPLAPLRTLSELVFLDMARKTEIPTETGNGNSAEIRFLPTTSEFQFNSAATGTGAVHGGNEGLVATFIRWCDLVRERSPRTLDSYRYVLGHLVRWLEHRSVDGFRQSSKRESWKDLVNEASRRPKSLGFIEFEDGVPGLGRIVGRPPTTIWRHLNSWAQTGGRRPLVIVDELKEPGLKPRAYMIQIPLLTQWLLFTASMRAFKDSGMPNAMSWHQLRRLPGLFTAIGSPPPPHGLPLTYQDAEQLIRTARSEAAHQNRSRRRSR